jgi:hypothetical protein
MSWWRPEKRASTSSSSRVISSSSSWRIRSMIREARFWPICASSPGTKSLMTTRRSSGCMVSG